MAVTTESLETLLRDLDRRYERRGPYLVVPFIMDTYRSPTGASACTVLMYPASEAVLFFVPNAFVARGAHVDCLLRACATVQWRNLLVKFEYDEAEAELRAAVDLPLDGTAPTASQIDRCLRGLVMTLEAYYPTLLRALNEGVIGLPPEPFARQEAARMVADALAASDDPIDREAATAIAASGAAGSEPILVEAPKPM